MASARVTEYKSMNDSVFMELVMSARRFLYEKVDTSPGTSEEAFDELALELIEVLYPAKVRLFLDSFMAMKDLISKLEDKIRDAAATIRKKNYIIEHLKSCTHLLAKELIKKISLQYYVELVKPLDKYAKEALPRLEDIWMSEANLEKQSKITQTREIRRHASTNKGVQTDRVQRYTPEDGEVVQSAHKFGSRNISVTVLEATPSPELSGPPTARLPLLDLQPQAVTKTLPPMVNHHPISGDRQQTRTPHGLPFSSRNVLRTNTMGTTQSSGFEFTGGWTKPRNTPDRHTSRERPLTHRTVVVDLTGHKFRQLSPRTKPVRR